MKFGFKTEYLFSLCLFGLSACSNSSEPHFSRRSLDSSILQVVPAKDSLIFEEIDSTLFQTTLLLLDTSQNRLPCISNQAQAELLLKDRVRINQEGNIEALYFKNGLSITDFNHDYSFFKAYYPTEDILVCEGGHSSDVTYNLSTGAATEETGNPEYMVSNMKKNYRLTGYYGGQECVSYFIQKKTDSGFQKIISFKWGDANRQTPDICNIEQAHWGQENQLFIYAQIFDYKLERPRNAYYRLTVIEK